MSRRHRAKKRKILPDPYYNSILIHMLVNRIMKDGKKTLAYKIVYQVMELLSVEKNNNKEDSLQILNKAIENVTPIVEVKPKRVGGSVFQVPLKVKPERGTVLAIQWIISAANTRAGKNITLKLKNEIVDASNKIGGAVRRRTEITRMAEANKAFARSKK